MPENTRTSAAERLRTALADTAPEGGFTAPGLSEATGLGRSTVTKLLAELEARGAVRRETTPRVDGKPQPTRWHTTPAPTADPDPDATADTNSTVADAAVDPAPEATEANDATQMRDAHDDAAPGTRTPAPEDGEPAQDGEPTATKEDTTAPAAPAPGEAVHDTASACGLG
ncbi:MarR family transcriptional regulator [Embleya sp. NPDC008237]|uniref:MarR family transcriptional regulator n=1 Tax=Embleya sp. NPDC008237 TaxID=3363978 RepID=UPI0036E70B26